MNNEYTLNDYVYNLNQYMPNNNRQPLQVTPEQMEAYTNIFNIQAEQERARQAELAQLQKAQRIDNNINTVGNMLNAAANVANNRRGLPVDLVFRDFSGNVIGQMKGDGGYTRQPQQYIQPTQANTIGTQQQMQLREEARQRELANAQEMAKLQDALAVANQYGIPISQAIGLSGKDILGYEQGLRQNEANITKEMLASEGDLYNTALKGQLENQLQQFKAENDLNLQQDKYFREGLLEGIKGNNAMALEKYKQAGLNDRQVAELNAKMNIAKMNAQNAVNVANINANAARYGADKRAQSAMDIAKFRAENPINSASTMNAWINQYWALPPEQQEQLIQANPQIFGLIQQMGNPQTGDANFQ